MERCCWEDNIDTARAAIAAHEAALQESGLVIVPRDPTEEMLAAADDYAGRAENSEQQGTMDDRWFRECWQAMIDKALEDG